MFLKRQKKQEFSGEDRGWDKPAFLELGWSAKHDFHTTVRNCLIKTGTLIYQAFVEKGLNPIVRMKCRKFVRTKKLACHTQTSAQISLDKYC